jgi:nickel-type superoxide dismutase maturation protease
VIGITTVRIVGPSMEPVLRNGEVYLALTGVRIRAGDVVILRHPRRPEMLTVKRVIRREVQQGREGWWVEGDNPDSSTDSREFGAVDADLVLGRLILRLAPPGAMRSTRR